MFNLSEEHKNCLKGGLQLVFPWLAGIVIGIIVFRI